MLTILAMARMGPWLLSRIDVLPGRIERCQRCSTKIKYVWVMEKQTTPMEVWRIGSECGPELEEMSQLLWKQSTAPFKLSIKHLTTLERIRQWEFQAPDLAPKKYPTGWALEMQGKLSAGLTPHQRRVMGSHVSQAHNSWKEAIEKALRSTSGAI